MYNIFNSKSKKEVAVTRSTGWKTLTCVIVMYAAVVCTSLVLEFGVMNMALGQGAAPPQSSTLTPAQRAMCDPNNPSLAFVNTTESHVCGLPPSIPSNTTTTTPTPTPSATSPSPNPP
jgi:hypothetical protein